MQIVDHVSARLNMVFGIGFGRNRTERVSNMATEYLHWIFAPEHPAMHVYSLPVDENHPTLTLQSIAAKQVNCNNL